MKAILTHRRTEYGKRIRKDYEAHRIAERRCNMREYVSRDDGISNTITTVTKDNYLLELYEQHEIKHLDW